MGALIAGPFAGRLLADMGADVIKIEAPDRPDPMRDWGKTVDGHGLWWPVMARNKRCVTLDLRQPEGQALALRLVESCDVVLENFRPGTLERWGLGYDALSERNPGVVLARVSGYGQDGPYADRVGFASAAEAYGGLRHLNGFPEGPPPRYGVSLGDSLGAMFAVQGVLAALYHREAQGGRGQVVDVSLVESCFAMTESVVTEYAALGEVRGASGTNLAGIAPSNLFRSRDHKWVVIAANQDTLFRRLCDVMGAPQLADDPRFVDHISRGRHQDEIEGIIADWASGHDADDLGELLNAAGVVCAPVNTAADILADEHFAAREMVITQADSHHGEVRAPGVVPRFSATPSGVRWSGKWEPGCDNRAVYGDLLGITDTELDRLAQAGIV